ncbi:MAG: PP2C family serine/threonine-protein phosphatase [Candidatus Kariarchaeaceae archaeon]|jgi:hypothetical protein
MSERAEVLKEFFSEFQERLNRLTNRGEKPIDQDILLLLVENLVLKYENRVQNDRGFLSRLRPRKSHDTDIENNINLELEKLMIRYHINGKPTTLPVEVSENEILKQWESMTGFTDQTKFSKTNLPPDIDIALHINPLQGKGQDHVDFFINDSGNAGIVLCDGVSGDGPASTDLAQALPKALAKRLNGAFKEELTQSQWQQTLEESLNEIVNQYNDNSGATTILVAIIDKERELIYTGWMGDGHIIHFNEELTGFAKLLSPHQNREGRLTRVVTADGLIGKPSTQIISAQGGALIMASDGYQLSNGRVLRHLFQKVIRQPGMDLSLLTWGDDCCDVPNLHPIPTDDQSIGILRWRVQK